MLCETALRMEATPPHCGHRRTCVLGLRPERSASGARDSTITLCPPAVGLAVKCHSLYAPAGPEAVAWPVLPPSARALTSLGGAGSAGGGGLERTRERKG